MRGRVHAARARISLMSKGQALMSAKRPSSAARSASSFVASSSSARTCGSSSATRSSSAASRSATVTPVVATRREKIRDHAADLAGTDDQHFAHGVLLSSRSDGVSTPPVVEWCRPGDGSRAVARMQDQDLTRADQVGVGYRAPIGLMNLRPQLRVAVDAPGDAESDSPRET